MPTKLCRPIVCTHSDIRMNKSMQPRRLIINASALYLMNFFDTVAESQNFVLSRLAFKCEKDLYSTHTVIIKIFVIVPQKK